MHKFFLVPLSETHFQLEAICVNSYSSPMKSVLLKRRKTHCKSCVSDADALQRRMSFDVRKRISRRQRKKDARECELSSGGPVKWMVKREREKLWMEFTSSAFAFAFFSLSSSFSTPHHQKWTGSTLAHFDGWWKEEFAHSFSFLHQQDPMKGRVRRGGWRKVKNKRQKWIPVVKWISCLFHPLHPR